MALTSGAKYLEAYNWEGGMNDEQMYADAVTYATDTTMLTTGYASDCLTGGWLEVGHAYSLDPMGEMRKKTTFPAEAASGHIGMLGTANVGKQVTETTVGGKSVASAPQNYSRGKNPGKE